MKFEAKQTPYDEEIFRAGVTYYSQLIEISPDNTLFHGALGFAHYYLKEYDKAILAYNRAVSQKPTVYALYWDLGMIHYQLQQYQLAVTFLNRSIGYMNELIPRFMTAAETFRANGDGTTYHLLQRVISRAQYDEERLFYALVKSYYQLEQYAVVRRVAMVGLENYPRSTGLLYYCGVAHFLNRDFQQAVDCFNRILAVESDDINTYYYRGLCWKELGDTARYLQDHAQAGAMRSGGLEPKKYYDEELRLHLNQDIMIFLMTYRRQENPS